MPLDLIFSLNNLCRVDVADLCGPKKKITFIIKYLVPRAGLEPARSCLRGILNPLCLPIPPPGQIKYYF